MPAKRKKGKRAALIVNLSSSDDEAAVRTSEAPTKPTSPEELTEEFPALSMKKGTDAASSKLSYAMVAAGNAVARSGVDPVALSLPPEVLAAIIAYLPYRTVRSVALVCRQWASVVAAEVPRILRTLYCRQWQASDEDYALGDWKGLYMTRRTFPGTVAAAVQRNRGSVSQVPARHRGNVNAFLDLVLTNIRNVYASEEGFRWLLIRSALTGANTWHALAILQVLSSIPGTVSYFGHRSNQEVTIQDVFQRLRSSSIKVKLKGDECVFPNGSVVMLAPPSSKAGTVVVVHDGVRRVVVSCAWGGAQGDKVSGTSYCCGGETALLRELLRQHGGFPDSAPLVGCPSAAPASSSSSDDFDSDA